jgi:hypothetical protein
VYKRIRMSTDQDTAPVFAAFFGKAWTLLSIVVGLVLLGMFFFGPVLMNVGGIVWALLRWIFSPII